MVLLTIGIKKELGLAKPWNLAPNGDSWFPTAETRTFQLAQIHQLKKLRISNSFDRHVSRLEDTGFKKTTKPFQNIESLIHRLCCLESGQNPASSMSGQLSVVNSLHQSFQIQETTIFIGQCFDFYRAMLRSSEEFTED